MIELIMIISNRINQTMNGSTLTIRVVSETDSAGNGTERLLQRSKMEDLRQDFLQDLRQDLLQDPDMKLLTVRAVTDRLLGLREEQRLLTEQVRSISSSLPPNVSSALCAAEEAGRSTNTLMERERVITHTLNQHQQEVRELVEVLVQPCSTVDSILRHVQYLRCLQHIQELSASVQQCLMTNGVQDAILSLNTMAELEFDLQSSQCSHLHHFLQETLRFWHKIIKDRLTTDFEKVLSQLQWPIVAPPSQSLTPPTTSADLSGQLETLTSQLIALQRSDDIICGGSSLLEARLCLPVQVMLLPLTKRFRYHFTGNRATNVLSKPEWYLTQVLMWMESSSSFMDEKIQPVIDRAGGGVNARVELCRGLLPLVQEKVSSDASRLLYDDVLLCHLVEEVLQFEKELRSSHSYPAPLPGLLPLLLEDAVLQKWLGVEKKMAVERMDAMLCAEQAWSVPYRDLREGDLLKAPDCAETFMTLLQVITERYRPLPSPSAQLKFFDLQKELVDDFRIRLTQVMKEESRCPLSLRYCSILNAVNYIHVILSDWADNVFFLQLQQAAVCQCGGGSEVSEVGRLASMEGSLLDPLLSLLDRLKTDMLGRLLERTLRDITEHSHAYTQQRWLWAGSHQDQWSMCLSSSACPMMMCIRDKLLTLQQLLSSALFLHAWRDLALRLDRFIYQEVILSNHFSEGGASQLHFDMNRNLFPLFGHFSKRPENYFKHVKEACLLLCLSSGSALLLKEALSDGDPPPQTVLQDLSIYCLAPSDALILLNLRTSWTPDHQ